MFLENVISNLGGNIVYTAHNGEDALLLIERHFPDVVLLDIGLSGKINGIETARIVNEKYKVPFVYITGNSDLATLETAKKTHPLHIIHKPIDEHELRSEFKIIREKIHRAQAEKS
jgi:YesN/AraC family two-component response regulator